MSSTPAPTVSRAVRTSNSSVLASRRPNGFQPSLIARNPRALAGEHFDDGVDVVLGREFLGPAAFDGAAREPGQTQIDNLHGRSIKKEFTTEARRTRRRQIEEMIYSFPLVFSVSSAPPW